MDRPVPPALAALERSLQFAKKSDRALASLRDLEALVRRAASEAGERPLAPAQKSAIDRLLAHARGFENAPPAERRRLVASIEAELAILAAPADGSESHARIRSLSAEGSLAPIAIEGEVLARSLRSLRGVGPSVAEKLAARGLVTLGDALLYLPRRYEDRRQVTSIARARPGEKAVLVARVVEFRQRFARKLLYELVVEDDTGELVVRWFGFRPGQHKAFVPGAPLVLTGEVRSGWHGEKEIIHPDLELGDAANDEASFGRIIPVYTEVAGISARFYRRLALKVVEACAGHVADFYSQDFRDAHKLAPLDEALGKVHFPPNDSDFGLLTGFATPAQARLVFDELFFVQLGLALKKRGVRIEPGIPLRVDPPLLERVLSRLPFTLTGAQRRALDQIVADLRRSAPMNRLLQGDVGSGKTAVALASALVAVENGFQAAVMAPTELLAEQHHRTFTRLLGGDLLEPARGGPPIRSVLLSSGLSQKEQTRTLNEIASGTARIVVGTHALIQEGVKFQRLGLVVVDEQHRFGVLQRAALIEKGLHPHVLVMTATPIPRTLALMLYGDLDQSIIDELPPGRTPVVTRSFSSKTSAKAYDLLRRELAQGRQAYVVLPLVEESEKLDLKSATEEFARLSREELRGFTLGLVHGRLSSEERAAAMEAFRRGKTQVLVATTVIEVGVDVPNASVMVVEHAERFGLSQLHQLRGRVGRGAAKSYCLLVHDETKTTAVARERLAVMVKTTDGFKIAEHDLRLRGPGEFLGTKQSGLPDLLIADLLRDQAILVEARKSAQELIERDPNLRAPEHRSIARELMRRWAGKLSLARVG